jgi:serine/threonine protein kinase/Tol biopolymer transport system component
MMCAEQRKDEEAIYYEAISKSEGERRVYLEDVCGGDEELLGRLEALLLAREESESFLEEPVLGTDITWSGKPLSEVEGTVIGRYKLLEKIGEGGMAVVYMAEQQEPIHRKVAIKIIKAGMDTKQVIARFEAERQALAMMDHPNIAKVLDAGATETGRPYFAMELVRGVSITEYCDKNKLNTQERLDLFIQVCNAVQHAHQKGIIHRDIKPTNVMVTLHDDKAVPKVIDFGIAKATSQKLTEKTLFTRYAQMIGTPEYMSPEQAQFSGLDIDTRTDIYSLGVLLYELLTGTTPFDVKELREGGYGEIQRIIQETEPPRPSTKLSTMGEALIAVAEQRKTNPDLLRKSVKGDLDWIVMKSLEKDRTRRYEAVSALAVDIQRHLSLEPVEAGPPRKIYRLKKFLRKYRTQTVATAMIAGLFVCMALASAVYLRGVKRARESAFLEHRDILSKAMEFRSMGRFEDALTGLDPILNSKHVGPAARLLRARLVLELQGPRDAVKELQKLLDLQDEIACQAHFLLARIYLESDPGDPETTQEYQQKAKEYQQEGEKLFSESAESYFNRSIMAGTVIRTLEWLNKAVDLDPGHYDSREARALTYYALREYDEMEIDASVMIGIESNNPQGYALRAIARREMATERGQRELFTDAIRDHNRAIAFCPDEHELHDQRRQTHLRMGNYEQALSDARACVQLGPDERWLSIHRTSSSSQRYHFHVFCALVATGRYDEAKVKYDTIIESGPRAEWHFDRSAAKYVSDTLDAGLSWHPPRRRPEGAAFLAMHEAADVYRQLAKKARRVVPEGFHATWSPDGTELAYSCGILGFTGIEVVNLESGRTRLLTVPGLDPAWSPDGEYIAFTRPRQTLSVADLTAERAAKDPSLAEREVWIIKSDGTGDPELLVRGYWQDRAKPTPIIWCPSPFPTVSPDEKYIACRGVESRIVEMSTNSVVASWTVPQASGVGFLSWSPDGQKLSVGDYGNSGLWIYDSETKEASKVLSGSFGWCSWSAPDISKIAIGRVYGESHHEIWVADTAALGPGRTIEEHCQEMVDYYTRRVDTDPEDEGLYLLRAKLYVRLQEGKKAIADLNKYAGIVKNPSKAAGAYADVAVPLVPEIQEMANPDISMELFRKAHEMQPENWLYLSGLARAYYRAGQWKEAIAAIAKSAKMPDGNNGLNFLCLSMAHWQLGEKEQATHWHHKAIEWIQHSTIDTPYPLWQMIYYIYPEAAELMGIAGTDPTIFDGCVGEYDYGRGAILTVTREEERLFAQMTGQLAFEIFPKSETEFFWKNVNAQIEFVKDDEGKVIKAIINQGGKNSEGAKIK